MSNFKPFKDEKVITSLRIELSTLELIDKLANEIDVSRNAMIIQCIEYALKNLKR